MWLLSIWNVFTKHLAMRNLSWLTHSLSGLTTTGWEKSTSHCPGAAEACDAQGLLEAERS